MNGCIIPSSHQAMSEIIIQCSWLSFAHPFSRSVPPSHLIVVFAMIIHSPPWHYSVIAAASLVRSLARYLSSHCLCHDNTFSSEFQVGCPFIHRQCREKVSIVLSPRCTTRLTAVRLYVVVTTRRYLDIVQYWYGTCTIHTGEGQYGTFEKQHTTQRASTQPI